MFLEDSIVGLQVCQELHLALLNKISELLSAVLQQASLRDEPLCYAAVKVSKEQKWAQIILVPFMSLLTWSIYLCRCVCKCFSCCLVK